MIACDVVILPPDEVMAKAVRMNRELSGRTDNEIVLDPEKCLPHITVAMGCFQDSDLSGINSVLFAIAADFDPLTLSAEPSEENAHWINIRKDGELKLLHEAVMRFTAPFFSYTPEKYMFSREEGEGINEVTLDYVSGFSSGSSLKNYKPHITVQSGRARIDMEPFEFISDKLALCHLGNFCTCRKIISTYRLS